MLSCLLLSGCVAHTELNEKAIIEAVGVDYEKGSYKVTLQYYNLSGSGSRTSIDTSQPNVLVASGTGTDVYSALSQAEFTIGRELMLGINQMVIIGEEASKQRLSEVMGFATTYYQSHPRMLICAAEGKAEDVLKVKFVEGSVSTQKLKFILQNGQHSGCVVIPTVLDLYIALSEQQKALCLPLLTTVETGTDASEDGKSVEIKGGMLYKDETGLKPLSIDEMSGVALISNSAVSSVVTADTAGGENKAESVAIEIYNSKSSIEPIITDDKVVFKVLLDAHGKFLDSYTHGRNSPRISELNSSAAQKLSNRMEAAAKMVIENSVDVLRLELLVKHCNYKAWEKLHKNWDEVLKNAEFNFTVKVSIDRYGLEE